MTDERCGFRWPDGYECWGRSTCHQDSFFGHPYQPSPLPSASGKGAVRSRHDVKPGLNGSGAAPKLADTPLQLKGWKARALAAEAKLEKVRALAEEYRAVCE